MGDFFESIKKIFQNINSKLNSTQKFLVIGAIILLIVVFVFIIIFSSKPEKALLYQKPLSLKDLAKVTAALEQMNIQFETRDDKYIILKDQNTAATVRMKLAQQGIIPDNVTGYELFDMEKWTTTDFERNINLQRAIRGEIVRHLKLLPDIEDCYLNIAWPKESLFASAAEPITASLTIIPSPYSDILENKKKIEGIKKIVAYGVPGLKEENVVITDPQGNVISDFSEDEKTAFLDIAKEQLLIQERERVRREQQLREKLKKVLGDKKIDIQMTVEITFDQTQIEKNEVIPVVIKPDNPNTPYDDSVVKENVPISEETINKETRGPNYVPEGPPGTEPNVPPNYKENLADKVVVKENQKITNYELSRKKTIEKKTPYQIKRITCAVWIDGTWEIEVDKNGNYVIDKARMRYKRKYIPIPQEELKKIEEIVKAAIGYDKARGDIVTVKNIPFNHEEEFAKEDAVIRRREMIKKALITGAISILVFGILILVYRLIAAEIHRRRKLKEEELLRKQQELRERALQAAEKEGIEVELSMEEKARLELQENAINMAREHPEEVAKLIRTWLAEDEG